MKIIIVNESKIDYLFKIPTIGNGSKYTFGFVTPQQTKYNNTNSPEHGIVIDGNGILYGSETVYLSENKQKRIKQNGLDNGFYQWCFNQHCCRRYKNRWRGYTQRNENLFVGNE